MQACSKIILVVLDIGEVYLVDRRKEYRSRTELVEEGSENSRSRSRVSSLPAHR